MIELNKDCGICSLPGLERKQQRLHLHIHGLLKMAGGEWLGVSLDQVCSHEKGKLELGCKKQHEVAWWPGAI